MPCGLLGAVLLGQKKVPEAWSRSVSAVFKDSQEAGDLCTVFLGRRAQDPRRMEGRGVGTGGGLLGQYESLGVGSIFKDEKPLENFEQRGHILAYSLAHDWLSRRVCRGLGGGQRGAGAERRLSQHPRHEMVVLGPDWKWWKQRNGAILNLS